jgi:HEAT repeat protein
MADATIKKLLSLLQAEQSSEIRRAAALVLGEIGDRDGEPANALTALLDDPDVGVRLRAIGAIARLRIEQALPKLLERVQAGGEEAEHAVRAAAQLGAKATRALQALMDKTAPGLRRRIAGALAGGGTASAETAAVDALSDKDPGVVEAAARSLIAKIPSFTAQHRRPLADQVLALLKDRKSAPPISAETALVRLLTALDDKRASSVLWERIGPSYPAELRAAALQALGKWIRSPARDELKQLLACANDSDFRVAAPALMILQSLPAGKQPVSAWLQLLDAHDATVRGFAVEKLAERDTAEVASALLAQLQHPDQSLREKALAGLARMKHGRQGLAQAILDTQSPESSWLLAKALAPHVKDFPTSWRQPLLRQISDWLMAGDRRAEPLLFLLREADARELTDYLETRGLELRKKKKYAEAVSFLRVVARDPACPPPIRMELAGSGLKISSKDLAGEARSADSALQQFQRLLPIYQPETLAYLKKAKWLEPEDFFYLGFHFAESEGPTRRFGGEVLKLLIQRSPRSKLGQDAKRKLRGSGLE